MSMDDNLKPQFKRLAALELTRAAGTPDEEIARTMGDCYGDPKIMYGKIKAAGTPICTECGETWPDEDHDCTQPKPKKKARKFKGDTEGLPDAAGAVALFEGALDRLRVLLTRLPRRQEYRRASRFVAHHELTEPGESVRTYSRLTKREEMTPEKWGQVCEEYDLDPDAGTHEIPYRCETAAFDAPFDIPTDYPAEPLPALVAAYALTGWDIEELVEKLHPDPERVNLGELNKEVGGLRRKAELVAAVVRGGKSGAGKRGAEITVAERRLAGHIQELQGRGWSEEMIAKRLREDGFKPLPDGFEATVEEVRRLAD